MNYDCAGVSIIMPCYNTDPIQLGEAVKSILDQKFTDGPFEIIIVDDGSKDTRTLKVLDQLRSFHECVRVIYQPSNKGQSKARNVGLNAARYKYVVPIDSDDQLRVCDTEKGYLQQAYKYMQENSDAVVAYCGADFIGSREGKFYIPPFSERLLIITDVIPVYGMHLRSEALEIQGYDETMRGAEDWEYWVRLFNHRLKNGKAADVIQIKGQHYLYRQHADDHNVHSSHGLSYVEIQNKIIDRNPEIFEKYFPHKSRENLPEFLRSTASKLVKRLPSDLNPDSYDWLEKNWERMSLHERTLLPSSIIRESRSEQARDFFNKVSEDPIAFFREMAKSSGYGVTSIEANKKSLHFISDPMVAAKISREPEIYQKSKNVLEVMSFFGGDGIFTSGGDKWKKQRKVLAPHFNRSANHQNFQQMKDLVDESLSTWGEGGTIAPHAYARALTLQIFVQTLFNEKISIEESDKVALAIENASSHIFETLTSYDYYAYGAHQDLDREKRKKVFPLLKFINKLASKKIGTTDEGRNLLNDVMMQVKETTPTEHFYRQVREEIQHLLLAGHETTGSALSWAMYILAQHQDIQDKLYNEIITNFSGGQIKSAEDLRKLPYLMQVMKEVFRQHSPLCLSLAREVVSEPSQELKERGINKGDIVFTMTDAMHHNPEWFREPDQFMPERFASDTEKTWPAGSYIPFFSGAHTCPGQMMAVQEIGVALASIFSKYSLSNQCNLTHKPKPQKTLINTASSEHNLVFRLREPR